MKNSLLNQFLILIAFGFTFFAISCEKEAEVKPIDTESKSPQVQSVESENEVVTEDLILSRSGDRTSIYKSTVNIAQGEWKGLHLKKTSMSSSHKYVAVVKVDYGNPNLYVFNYNPTSSDRWRYVRNAFNGNTEETYLLKSDLRSDETHGSFWVNGQQGGKYTIEIFIETIGGGSSNNNLSVSGYTSSPSSGKKSETNFQFKALVNTNTTSGLNVKVEFIAPDNNTYKFDMQKSGTYYYHNRTLSLSGTYRYRYVATQNGTTKASGYYNLSVEGCETLNVPHYKQPATSEECGQHCVKMVLAHYGDYASINDIKVAMNKTSRSNVGDQSKGFNALTSSGKRAYYRNNWSMNQLENEICQGDPVMVVVKLYLRDNNKEEDDHVMVLTGIDDQYVYVNDPWVRGAKNKKYTRDQFYKSWNANNRYVIYFH